MSVVLLRFLLSHNSKRLGLLNILKHGMYKNIRMECLFELNKFYP